ncbi:MAG: hypothetical protein AAFY57_02945 [Cyanobacteria bacterium J06642_2]
MTDIERTKYLSAIVKEAWRYPTVGDDGLAILNFDDEGRTGPQGVNEKDQPHYDDDRNNHGLQLCVTSNVS